MTRLDLQGKIAVPLTDGDGAPVARWVLFHGGERVATLSQPQTAETLQRLGYTPVDARHGSVVLAALSGLEDVLAAPGRREPSSKPAAVPAITTGAMPPSPAAPAQPAPDIDARALAARIVAEARRAVDA